MTGCAGPAPERAGQLRCFRAGWTGTGAPRLVPGRRGRRGSGGRRGGLREFSPASAALARVGRSGAGPGWGPGGPAARSSDPGPYRAGTETPVRLGSSDTDRVGTETPVRLGSSDTDRVRTRPVGVLAGSARRDPARRPARWGAGFERLVRPGRHSPPRLLPAARVPAAARPRSSAHHGLGHRLRPTVGFEPCRGRGQGPLTSAGPCLNPKNPSPGRPGLSMRRSPLGGSRTPGLGADVLFRRFILGEGAGWRGRAAAHPGPFTDSSRPAHAADPGGSPASAAPTHPSTRPPRPSTPSSRPTEPERPGTGVRHRNPPPGRDRSSTCRLPQTRSALIHLHPWVEAGHPRSPPVIHPGSDLPTWDSP